MEKVAEKSKKRDGSCDSFTDTMSESRNSSTDSSKSSSDDASSFEAKTKEYSASCRATRGWPLPKPQPAKCFKIEEDGPQLKDDERIKLRKLSSRVSGLS